MKKVVKNLIAEGHPHTDIAKRYNDCVQGGESHEGRFLKILVSDTCPFYKGNNRDNRDNRDGVQAASSWLDSGRNRGCCWDKSTYYI